MALRSITGVQIRETTSWKISIDSIRRKLTVNISLSREEMLFRATAVIVTRADTQRFRLIGLKIFEEITSRFQLDGFARRIGYLEEKTILLFFGMIIHLEQQLHELGGAIDDRDWNSRPGDGIMK